MKAGDSTTGAIDLLDQPATGAEFARLVGVSHPAISKQISNGVLAPGRTLRIWLIDYCDHLREQAAGRGGEDFSSLTRARTRDAENSADLKELQIKEKAGELVPIAVIEPMITAMITAARQELLSLPEKLTGEIRALHGVDVDAALIEERIHEALNHLAGSVPQLSGDDVSTRVRAMETASDVDDY